MVTAVLWRGAEGQRGPQDLSMQDLHRTASRDPQPPQGGRNRAQAPTSACTCCHGRLHNHTHKAQLLTTLRNIGRTRCPSPSQAFAMVHAGTSCMPFTHGSCSPAPCHPPGPGGNHLKVLWLRHPPAPGRDGAQGFGPGIGYRPRLLRSRQAGGRDRVRHRCARRASAKAGERQ